MSVISSPPRRTAAAVLLLAALVWAVPNGIAFVDQVRLLNRDDITFPDNYRLFHVVWTISSGVAVLTVVAAALNLVKGRLGHLVLVGTSRRSRASTAGAASTPAWRSGSRDWSSSRGSSGSARGARSLQ